MAEKKFDVSCSFTEFTNAGKTQSQTEGFSFSYKPLNLQNSTLCYIGHFEKVHVRADYVLLRIATLLLGPEHKLHYQKYLKKTQIDKRKGTPSSY